MAQPITQPNRRGHRTLGVWVVSVAGVAAVTVALEALGSHIHIAIASSLYLLLVVTIALQLGRGPAALASVLAFLACDWFFAEPRYRLTVSDPAEWLALLGFLVVAQVVGQLTALLRERADEARQREREAAALADASWAVASQPDRERALAEVLRRLLEVSGAAAAAVFVEHDHDLALLAQAARLDSSWQWDQARLREPAGYVLSTGRAVAWDDDHHHWDKALGEADIAYLPLLGENRVAGVLSLRGARRLGPAERRAVESLANHAGVVLERERLSQLAWQAEALREADRLKTALLSMISHDFRSPLASIKAGLTGLLQEGAPVDEATWHELLSGMDAETDRLNRLVENVLALSRLEAGAWHPQMEASRVDELVGAALDSFTPAENQRIEVALADDLAEVEADPVQLVQVLHNLVENALKYSSDGSPVSLTTRRDGAVAWIEVADRGPGLPPGGEERIFEPFYRAPERQESGVSGLGLGLAVCHGLVSANGGELTAAPRDGGGTVFRIRLAAGDTSR